MVCIYCNHPTTVSNSRKSKKDKSVWRRRSCNTCVAQFTTKEIPEYSTTLVVRCRDGAIQSFSRDKLFLSIHRSLEHLENAIDTSSAITDTVLRQLLDKSNKGLLPYSHIIDTVHLVLSRYDTLATNIYKAHHPIK